MPERRAAGGEWFMDYRNADGVAGRDVRQRRPGVRPLSGRSRRCADPGTFAVATRAGLKRVVVPDGHVRVDMGAARFPGPVSHGASPTLRRARGRRVAVDMGNPHAVAFVDDLADGRPADGPAGGPPAGAFPAGVNVEFAVAVAPAHLAMRVHESGVGETQSCGTGACAVFAAGRRRPGADAPPAGSSTYRAAGCTCTCGDDGGIDLTGPAEILATGTIDPTWLEQNL